MKRTLVFIMAAIIIAPLFNSCKKGEDDPFISLKSRNKRLMGEWELKSMDATVTSSENSTYTYSKPTSTDKENYTETRTFDGSKTKTVRTTNYESASTQTYTATTTHTSYSVYTLTVTFDKETGAKVKTTGGYNTTPGSFVIASSPANSASNFSITNPYGASLDDGTYNEEIGSDYSSSNSDEYTADWYWLDSNKDKDGIYIEGLGMYKITKLSSKEMILKLEWSDTDASSYANTGTYEYSGSDDDIDTYVETLTFEKK